MSGTREEHPSLPQGWTWGTINEIGNLISGQHILKENYNLAAVGIPYLTGPDDFGPKFPIISKWTEKPKAMALENDTLITVKGAGVGKINLLGTSKAAISRQLMAIRSDYINSSYIYYYFKSVFPYLQKLGAGSTVPGIDRESILGLSIPIAPVNEQIRIASKIEELFSRLDAGVEELKKAKVQLQRYRQSVLKAAVEGRLTEGWRKAHPDVELAESLLIRIADKQHNGKRKANDNLNFDLYEIPNFPDSWTWTRIGDICDLIQYGTSEKAGDDPTGIPTLRMGNIQEGKLIFEKLKFMRKDYSEMNKFFLRDGDLLFNRTNSAELVGKTAVYKNYPNKSIFASYLIRLGVDRDFYDPDFLSYFINSSYGRKYIAAVVSQQVGQANVNGTKLASMTIPLPPIEEQKEIVEYVEHSRSASEDSEANIEKIRNHTAYLRQSILKSAFEGKLVPQNPNDEPASLLLERIKAGRTRIGSIKHKRPTTTTLNEFSG